MIGLVLVSHGRLAEELRLALEHVVGPQENVATVCIGPDDDMELRRADIQASICSVDDGRRRGPADRHVRRHAVEPGHLADGSPRRRGDRRGEPADAGQAGKGPGTPALGTSAWIAPRWPGANTSPPRRTCCTVARSTASAVELGRTRVAFPLMDGTRTASERVAHATICNRRGLHARAAAKFVSTAERFSADGRGGGAWTIRLRPVDHGPDDARRRARERRSRCGRQESTRPRRWPCSLSWSRPASMNRIDESLAATPGFERRLNGLAVGTRHRHRPRCSAPSRRRPPSPATASPHRRHRGGTGKAGHRRRRVPQAARQAARPPARAAGRHAGRDRPLAGRLRPDARIVPPAARQPGCASPRACARPSRR